MIKIQNVSKSYGENKVLDNISLNIEKGSFYGLVGESGAGKSTLLRCINGLIRYDSGSLKVNNIEINAQNKNSIRQVRKKIGMVFQNFSLIQRMSVFENVALPMRSWGYSESEIKSRVNKLLERVNIHEKSKSRPSELSGGQQQRVGIARAISMNPEILLCDEATSALDPSMSTKILDLIKEISEELGITVIMVTHQMEVVKQVCDSMGILECGNLTAEGLVKDIFFNNPPSLQKLMNRGQNKLLRENRALVKIEFSTESAESTLLSRLTKETNAIFSYVEGGIDTYKNRKLGIVTIEIDIDDIKNVKDFLNLNNVHYNLEV